MDEDPEKNGESTFIPPFDGNCPSTPPASVVRAHGGSVLRVARSLRHYRDTRICNALGVRDPECASQGSLVPLHGFPGWTTVHLDGPLYPLFLNSHQENESKSNTVSQPISGFDLPSQHSIAFSNFIELPEPGPTRSVVRRLFESFERHPDSCRPKERPAQLTGSDLSVQAQPTGTLALARTLKGRHLRMIAIAGSIGTLT